MRIGAHLEEQVTTGARLGEAGTIAHQTMDLARSGPMILHSMRQSHSMWSPSLSSLSLLFAVLMATRNPHI